MHVGAQQQRDEPRGVGVERHVAIRCLTTAAMQALSTSEADELNPRPSPAFDYPQDLSEP